MKYTWIENIFMLAQRQPQACMFYAEIQTHFKNVSGATHITSMLFFIKRLKTQNVLDFAIFISVCILN